MPVSLFGNVPGTLFVRALIDGEPVAWVILAGTLVFTAITLVVKFAFRRMA